MIVTTHYKDKFLKSREVICKVQAQTFGSYLNLELNTDLVLKLYEGKC